MDLEELELRKKKYDAAREAKSIAWAFRRYKKQRRFGLPYCVPEFDKKILEEVKKMSEKQMIKVRKQYSKNYQVIELEMEVPVDDYDVWLDYLDSKMTLEIGNIPQELLQKDNAGNKQAYNKPQYTPQKAANNYNKQKSGYQANGFGKPFGSDKQWAIIKKNEARLQNEQGLTMDDIVDTDHLKEIIGRLFNN